MVVEFIKLEGLFTNIHLSILDILKVLIKQLCWAVGRREACCGRGRAKMPRQVVSSPSGGGVVVICCGGGAACTGGDGADGRDCRILEGFSATMPAKRLKSPLLKVRRWGMRWTVMTATNIVS